jgi:imidazole glycerol-phosphate synthase subunit HisF
MLRTRVIPALLLRNESLVKTKQFDKFTYIGDPCNTVRIFNELEVDELLFLDITATKEGREPNYGLLKAIASECFMPLAYGGGIQTVKQAQKILSIGFEKICVNSAALQNTGLITEIANEFGSQAVVASIDYKKPFFGKLQVVKGSNHKCTGKQVEDWAKTLELAGAGEILLTSVDREGTWEGFDLDIVKRVSSVVSIPVVAHGGCGSVSDISSVVRDGGASAVALGSMVVFQKKGMGVLVSFPSNEELEAIIK